MSQNDNLPQALGKPLITTIRGVEVRLRPLTLGDLADMEMWTRKQQISMFREATEGMDEKERIATINLIVSGSLGDNAMDQALSSIAGVRQMLSMIMERVDGQEFKVDELVGIDNFKEVGGLMNSLSGLELSGSDPQEAGEASSG